MELALPAHRYKTVEEQFILPILVVMVYPAWRLTKLVSVINRVQLETRNVNFSLAIRSAKIWFGAYSHRSYHENLNADRSTLDRHSRCLPTSGRPMFRRLLPFAIFSLLTFNAAAETIVGTVVGISDGDTLTLLTNDKRQAKVRLGEIDTPSPVSPTAPRRRRSFLIWPSADRLRSTFRTPTGTGGPWAVCVWTIWTSIPSWCAAERRGSTVSI